MLHPIFSTVLGHPELVAEHLANYAALIKEEAAQAGRGVVYRLVAGILAAVAGMLALGLIGIAVMLGVLHGSFNWVLVIVPGVAVVCAVVAGWVASRSATAHAFEDLKGQIDADLKAMRVAGGRHAD